MNFLFFLFHNWICTIPKAYNWWTNKPLWKTEAIPASGLIRFLNEVPNTRGRWQMSYSKLRRGWCFDIHSRLTMHVFNEHCYTFGDLYTSREESRAKTVADLLHWSMHTSTPSMNRDENRRLLFQRRHKACGKNKTRLLWSIRLSGCRRRTSRTNEALAAAGNDGTLVLYSIYEVQHMVGGGVYALLHFINFRWINS